MSHFTKSIRTNLFLREEPHSLANYVFKMLQKLHNEIYDGVLFVEPYLVSLCNKVKNPAFIKLFHGVCYLYSPISGLC